MNDAKMKHTPGPWEVMWDGTTSSAGIRYAGEGGGIIASVDLAQRSDGASDPADAYLIAAAPEMLTALKLVETEIVTLKARLSGPYARNMEALLVEVRAALDKAEKG